MRRSAAVLAGLALTACGGAATTTPAITATVTLAPALAPSTGPPGPQEPAQPAVQTLAFELRERKLENPDVEIDVVYVEFRPPDDEARLGVVRKLNALLAQMADKWVTEFEKEIRDVGEQRMSRPSLSIKCKPVLHTSQFVSVECGHYEYGGGAHGNYTPLGYTYALDGVEPQLLQLGQLFREPSAGRARLVPLCSADLKSQGASNVGDEMTEVSQALGEFALEKDGLVLFFAPYSVDLSRNTYQVHVGWRALEPQLSERMGPLVKPR